MSLFRWTRPISKILVTSIIRQCYSVCTSGPESSSLGRWPAVYHQIASCATSNSILQNFPGLQQQHQMNAFLGDKLLGAAAAKVLSDEFPSPHDKAKFEQMWASSGENHWPMEKGSATRLVCLALSNQFLRRHASIIIPDHFNHIQEHTDHTVASAVEAAVGLVHQRLDFSDSDGAIKDLARYLMESAKEETSPFNAKGALLEIGATFDTSKHTNWLPERPLFQAQVVWEDQCVVATGRSKREAEQVAAQKVLTKWQPELYRKTRQTFPGDISKTLPKRSLSSSAVAKTDPEQSHTNDNGEMQWKLFTFSTNDFSLKNDESVSDWWYRGANKPNEAFRRALQSHHVFPDQVQSTRSWSCRWDEQYLAIILMECKGTVHSFVGSSRKSFSKARSAVGLEATAHLKLFLDTTITDT